MSSDFPEPGDTLWWRGFRCIVTGTNPGVGADEKGIVHYQTVDASIDQPDWVGRDGTRGRSIPVYMCSSNVADLVWNEDLELWVLSGLEGELPHYNKHGELIDPAPPRCQNCGDYTFHVALCAKCSTGEPIVPIQG